MVAGVGSQQLVEAVERRSVYGFRSGHMYSHLLLKEVEDVKDGVVRVSFFFFLSLFALCSTILVISVLSLGYHYHVYTIYSIQYAACTKMCKSRDTRQQRQKWRGSLEIRTSV